VRAALLIGVVSNVDNLGVGVAFGIRGARIGAVSNLIVAGITTAATAAAVTSGHAVSQRLPSGVAAWLGPLIIIVIGIATVLASAGPPRPPGDAHAPWPDPLGVDRIVSWRAAIVLGAALSLNNVGTGVGAGVSGVPAVATAVSAGLLSLVCVGGGSRVGGAFGRVLLGRHAPVIGGVLLLAVGAAMLPSVR
jgi:putative Mn2+ efflux pump MntP